MKKIISIAAAAAIIAGIFSMRAFAAEENAEFDKNVSKYNALEITDIDISQTSVKPDVYVTRSEFADIAARLMYADFKSISDEPTGDLGKNDKGIIYLHSVGIMNGNGNGEYEPDRNIKITEAVKILSAAAGYTAAAEADGGFKEGYMGLASRLGLLDGTSLTTDEITYSDLFKILDNFIETNVMEKTSSGYTANDTVTALEKYKKIRRATGIEETCGAASIYSYDGKGKDTAVIDGEEFNIGEVDCSDYVGMRVEYYYSYADDENILVYVSPYKNRTVTIMHPDIISFENGEYTYQAENSKQKTIRISDKTTYMYNGRRAEAPENFIPDCGYITFIDNNNDGQYEVLNIVNREIVIASSVITADMKITDKFNAEYNINLDSSKCDGYEIYTKDNQKTDLSGINANDILEIEKTIAERPFIKITVVNSSVSGKIESIDGNTADGQTAVIGGASYRIGKRFYDAVKNSEVKTAFEAGKECIVYLNSMNEIIYASSEYSTDYRLGFTVKYFMSDDGNDVIARIFDEGGTVENLMFASGVKTDSGRIKSKNIGINTFPLNSLIKYKTNIAGEITELYCPSEQSTLLKTVCTGESFYRNTVLGRIFARKESSSVISCAVDGKAKIFYLPSGYDKNGNAEDFSVLTAGQLVMWRSYNVLACNTKGESGYTDAAVVYSSEKYGYSDNSKRKPALINSIYEKLSDDGEVRTAMTVLMNGSENTVEIDDMRTGDKTSLPFNEGDVIYFAPASDGRFKLGDNNSNYNLLVKRDGAGFTFEASGYKYSKNNFSEDGIARFGTVYDTGSGYILLNPLNNTSDESTVERINLTASSAYVYIYDTENKEYRIGNPEEAIGYKNDKTGYSSAYVFVNYEYAIVIIYPNA